jgi:hypothetical protein
VADVHKWCPLVKLRIRVWGAEITISRLRFRKA